MIIKKLIIYGYGKWIDKEFDINEPFQLVFGENEAGKSTMMSFIHSIFFGFPTRHSSANRYEPKESSRYGGKIIIYDKRFGEVTVERVLGKVTGDVVVQLEDGTTGDEDLLTTLFHSKSRSFYESIYSFDLKGIEDIQELSKDQLNRFFLSIGALGHEKYLKQADSYHSQAGKLFKPMGRKPDINQLQTKLKAKSKVVGVAKEKNESYINLIKTNLSKQQQLETIEKELEETTEELNYLNELSKYQETLEEIEAIQTHLEKIPVIDLPDEGLYQLNQINSDIESYQMKIDELQEKQKALQHQYKPSKELLRYQQNEDDLSTFEKELDIWEDKAQNLQLNKKDRTNLKQTITETQIREDISLAEPTPHKLGPNEAGYLAEIRDRIIELEEHISDLEEAEKDLMYRIKINNDMIDKIEPQLVPLSKFKELSEMQNKASNKKPKQTKKKNTPAIMVLLAAAVVISLYLSTLSPLFGVLSAVAFTITGTFLFDISGKPVDDFSQKERDLLYQQKNLRSQWKELLAMNDEFQSKKAETDRELSDTNNLKRLISTDFDDWKTKHNYPEHVTVHSIFDKTDVYEKLNDLIEQESVLSESIERVESDLNKQIDAFENIFNRTFISEDVLEKFREVKRIFREIKSEQRQSTEYIKKTEAIQHEINYYVEKVNELKKEKRQFIESLDLTSEEEVYKLYTTQKGRKEKETRLAVLVDKLPLQEGMDLKQKLEHLDVDMRALKQQHQELTIEHKKIMKNTMEIDMQIKQLEDGGTYTELLQEFENEKSYYQEVVDEWAALKTAAGIIEKTLHYAKEDKLPYTLSIAESYFSFLTEGKYQRLSFDNDELYVMDNNRNQWRTTDLSRGTVEPLYISLRLAFIKATKESIQFPILIDDPFVNLDSSRVRKMYELLIDFDKDIQIIYFSFDERIRTFIEDDKCVYLKKQG